MIDTKKNVHKQPIPLLLILSTKKILSIMQCHSNIQGYHSRKCSGKMWKIFQKFENFKAIEIFGLVIGLLFLSASILVVIVGSFSDVLIMMDVLKCK